MRPQNRLPRAIAGIAVLLLAISLPDARAANSGQVIFPNSIRAVAVAPASGAVDPRKAYISRSTLKANESAAMMTIEVALKMRNFTELQARVDRGEHVSVQELAAKYEPLSTDYESVVDWLTSQGLTVSRRDSHHMAIFARGTVSQIQQAMQVQFARVTLGGKEYTSAVTAPSVPGSISSLLIGINGLQPHLHAHKHSIVPNATSESGASYTPGQIAQAYQASGLYGTNITGAGQTIAIIIDTFPAKSDLVAFWNAYGINQSINNITFIQAVAGTLDPVSGEETLDTEWSSSIAPGAKVRVYASADFDFVDLDAAYQQVIDDATNHPNLGIHQLSMSYGFEEVTATTPSQRQSDDGFFIELTNAGVTCFASSGDGGSTPSNDGNEDGPLQVEAPASDPNVIGVGGTTLMLDSNNNESSEVVWNDGAEGGATGGGMSVIASTTNGPYLSRPSWQTGTGVPAGPQGQLAQRLVPDIALTADPEYGADVYYTDPTYGLETTIGGTSWSSPTCAGFCALINQARANLGLGSIGELGPHLYPLILTSNFRDITSGNNATATSGGLYVAGTGYDMTTGIGVPLVQTLAKTLAGTQNLIGVGQPNAIETVNQGQNATITVTTSGSPVSYQWQRMPIGSTTWSNLSDTGAYSGSATTSLTVTSATTAMSGDQFQCVVTYAGTGAVTSDQSTTLIVETPWAITTLAGAAGTSGLMNNTGTAAEFYYPSGVAIDGSGNIYVADLMNNVIREVTPAGVVTTPYGSLTGVAGSANGAYNSATFNSPRDIAIDSSGNLYVSDEGNNLIRKITVSTGQVSTFAGTTSTTSPLFIEPKGLAVDSAGNVYVADSGNNVIRKITSTGTVSILAGSSTYVAGYANGAATTQALFNEPIGLAVDSSKNIYVTEYNNEIVREISSTGTVSTVAGQAGVAGCLDGTGSQALFNVPRGIVLDGSGNLYVTDSYAPFAMPPPELAGNCVLRKITLATGVVTTLAGQAGTAGSSDGIGNTAQFYNPCGLAMTASGTLYVADASNNTIRSAVVQTTVSVSATQALASAVGPADGQFTVSRVGSTVASLAVNYSVAGTAASGTDYTALTGTVTIPAGASSVTIEVIPLSPGPASNRTVQLTLTSSASGVLINSSPATVTIEAAVPSVTFSQWESDYSISSAASATPLNDGISNLMKYLFDIDPTTPMTAADRAALPTVGATTNGGTDYLTLTYREFASATGITVNVQTSPDLQTWTTLSNPAIVEIGTDPVTGDPILQAQAALTASTQFIRLNVTQP